jgi:hypothetical protein
MLDFFTEPLDVEMLDDVDDIEVESITAEPSRLSDSRVAATPFNTDDL